MCQTFGLDIYIGCLLCDDEQPQQKMYRHTQERLTKQCCSHKTSAAMCCGMRTLLHHSTALIPCSHAVSSIGLGHSIRVYLYTGNSDASPSNVLSGRYVSFCERAETQAVLLPLYISTASSPSCQPTRRLLQRYELVLASWFPSLAARKEEEEARRRKNRTRHASRGKLSDPVQHLLGSVYLSSPDHRDRCRNETHIYTSAINCPGGKEYRAWATLSSTVYMWCGISLVDDHRYDTSAFLVHRVAIRVPFGPCTNSRRCKGWLISVVGSLLDYSIRRTPQVLSGLMHGTLLISTKSVKRPRFLGSKASTQWGQTSDAKRRLLSKLMAGCDILSASARIYCFDRQIEHSLVASMALLPWARATPLPSQRDHIVEVCAAVP